MIDRPYNNPASQRERRATIKNDKRAHKATFHSHTHDDLNFGGRFAKEFPSTVVGATPMPRYPAQPATSPWRDEQPVEPPLGYAIDEPPVVGEPFEIEKSLAEASDRAGASPPGAAADALPGEVSRPVQHASARTARPRRFSRKRD